MRFRTLVVAALVLVLAIVGSFAAFTISDLARDEAAQTDIERTDELAVEAGVTQYLAPDSDHDPTNRSATVTVVYNGTEWTPAGNYSYDPGAGEIEFLRDEPDPAAVTFGYEIPENQVADEQLQTATEGYSDVAMALVGGSFIVLFIFIAGFIARRFTTSSTTTRGR